jgi:hypothetical protein
MKSNFNSQIHLKTILNGKYWLSYYFTMILINLPCAFISH